MGAVRLVTRADDGGGCESANAAVLEAIDAGTIRNASLMTNGAAFAEIADALRGRDDVCLGLHVTLNAEWERVKWGPVLPPERVPTLLEPGTSYFTPVPRSLHERGFSVAEAVAEVGAQLERARDTGLTISYLDEHMGVGWISGDAGKLGDALRDLAAREGLLYVADFKLSGLPRVNVPFVGDGPADPAESLTRYWLTALEATSAGDYLLVTHPGRVAPDMELFALAGQPTGVIARERDAERRALSSPELRAGLERLGVTPRRYDEL